MNIFILSTDPVKAAQLQCDKHVVKMILESAQLLCSAHEPESFVGQYKRTHFNHPCAVWTRTRAANYDWLFEHFVALVDEYRYRYKGRFHKSSTLIESLQNTPQDLLEDTFGKPRTPFVLAMPDKYKVKHPVSSYRVYYRSKQTKFHMAWTRRRKPAWF